MCVCVCVGCWSTSSRSPSSKAIAVSCATACRTWSEPIRCYGTSTTPYRSRSALWRRNCAKPQRTIRSSSHAGWPRRRRRRTGSTRRTRRTAGQCHTHVHTASLSVQIWLVLSSLRVCIRFYNRRALKSMCKKCERGVFWRWSPVYSFTNEHTWLTKASRSAVTDGPSGLLIATLTLNSCKSLVMWPFRPAEFNSKKYTSVLHLYKRSCVLH